MSRSARENIFDRQLKLQIEAGKLLDRTSLIEKLEDFGTVHLVGSTALGMLTQRDLDYDVVTKNRINFNSVLSLADELTRQHSLPEVIDRDRGRIMQIKERVARSPEYHRTFSGPDIYDAVLTHKVRDVQGFFNYLAA